MSFQQRGGETVRLYSHS